MARDNTHAAVEVAQMSARAEQQPTNQRRGRTRRITPYTLRPKKSFVPVQPTTSQRQARNKRAKTRITEPAEQRASSQVSGIDGGETSIYVDSGQHAPANEPRRSRRNKALQAESQPHGVVVEPQSGNINSDSIWGPATPRNHSPSDVNGSPILLGGTENEPDEENNLHDTPSLLQTENNEDSGPTEGPKFSAFGAELSRMSIESKRVGCRHIWSRVRTVETVSTARGKKLFGLLESLTGGYNQLQYSQETGNSDDIEISQGNVTAKIDALKVEIRHTLRSSLADSSHSSATADKTRKAALLTDIYFKIIPSAVEVLKLGVELNTTQGPMDTPALKRMKSLVESIHDLGVAAIRQPKDIHSEITKCAEKDYGIRSYQVTRPIKACLSIMNHLLEKFNRELESREQILRLGNSRQVDLEKERLRQEEELKRERELAAFRRRYNRDIHRKQKQAVEDRMADKVWGPIFAADMKRNVAKAGGKMEERPAKRHKSTGGRDRQDERPEVVELSGSDVDTDVDPFNDEAYERVSIFGKKRLNHNQQPQPWSDEERALFIDGLRDNRRDDRFQKLSEKLGRSMDEIFACAKELQESMNVAHEKGLMNKTCDDWTYHIWEKQVNRRELDDLLW